MISTPLVDGAPHTLAVNCPQHHHVQCRAMDTGHDDAWTLDQWSLGEKTLEIF